MSALILLGLAGLVCMLVVIVHPVRKCPRCRGSRVAPAQPGYKTCPRCRGLGRVPRCGAALVHRMLWEHLGPRVRDALRDLADQLREDHFEGGAK